MARYTVRMNPQPSKQTQQLLNQGVQWLQKGNLDRASGLFSSVLDLSPAEPDALHMMGVVARKQNRLNDAETFFRRSLEAEARQPQVLNNLANRLRGTERVDEAIDLYEKAVKMQPEFADGWFNLGLTHQARASHPAAIEAFRKAQAIKPGDPPDYPFPRASGGMISTARDYAIFCQMFLNGGAYGGERILSEASVGEATKPLTRRLYSEDELRTRRQFYGLGWSVTSHGVFSHGGSDGTWAWVDPNREIVGLVFTQSPGGTNPRDQFKRVVDAACYD